MSSEEERWRDYPPVRPDWRDLEGEEFNSYYLLRQREVARFLLDLDLPQFRPDPVHQLWWSLPDEKKDSILDRVMPHQKVRLPVNCDLGDPRRTGYGVYGAVIWLLGAMVDESQKPKKKAAPDAPRKGGDSLLRKAVLNSQSGK